MISAAPLQFPALTLDALADALECERKLLADLAQTLKRQRQGVASEDLQVVDESVFAAHRILHTLEEARRRRRSLLAYFAGRDDVPLQQLDLALGSRMTETVRCAWTSLVETARQVSGETSVNRRVLRDALAAGEAHVRAICGEPSARLYVAEADPQPVAAGAAGVLIDRKV